MNNRDINSDLSNRIMELEKRQVLQLHSLKYSISELSDNLKPSKMIKNTVRELNADSEFKSDLLSTLVGITSGFITKKIIVGNTHNPLKEIAGTLIEVVVAKWVSNDSNIVKSFANLMYKS